MKECRTLIDELTTSLKPDQEVTLPSNDGGHLDEAIEAINNLDTGIDNDDEEYNMDENVLDTRNESNDEENESNDESRDDTDTARDDVSVECEDEDTSTDGSVKSDCHCLGLCDMFVEGMIKMESIDISTLRVKKQKRIDCHNSFIIELFEKLSQEETVVVQKLKEMQEKVQRNDNTPIYMQKMRDLSNKRRD
jgi:hypothetical protein